MMGVLLKLGRQEYRSANRPNRPDRQRVNRPGAIAQPTIIKKDLGKDLQAAAGHFLADTSTQGMEVRFLRK